MVPSGAQQCPASCLSLCSSSAVSQGTAQPWSSAITHGHCPGHDPRAGTLGAWLLPLTWCCGAAPRPSRAEPCQAAPAPHRARDAGGNRLHAGKEVEAGRTSELVHATSLCPAGDCGSPNPPRALPGLPGHPGGAPGLDGHQGQAQGSLCAGFGLWERLWMRVGLEGTERWHSRAPQPCLPRAPSAWSPHAPSLAPGRAGPSVPPPGLGAGPGAPSLCQSRGCGGSRGQDRSRAGVRAHAQPGLTAVLTPSAGGEVKPKPQRG